MKTKYKWIEFISNIKGDEWKCRNKDDEILGYTTYDRGALIFNKTIDDERKTFQSLDDERAELKSEWDDMSSDLADNILAIVECKDAITLFVDSINKLKRYIGPNIMKDCGIDEALTAAQPFTEARSTKNGKEKG